MVDLPLFALPNRRDKERWADESPSTRGGKELERPVVVLAFDDVTT